MSFLLASLYSQSQKTAAIALLDKTEGYWRYVQKLKIGKSVNLNMILGISMLNNKLYAVSSASLQIYNYNTDALSTDSPLFNLEKEIILPEWILGSVDQAKLITVHASDKHQQVYVSNNAYCALDIFSLDGKFLKRHFLWEIAPNFFSKPQKWNKKFTYGVIRSINEHKNGKITLTVASCNGKDSGAIIDLETGDIILKDLEFAHGGLWDEDLLYTINVRKGTLAVYSAEANSELTTGNALIEIKPEIPYPWVKKNTEQNLRGLTTEKDMIYCGAFNLKQKIGRRSPARIIGICKKPSFLVKRQFVLPDMLEFQNPTLFDILSFPKDLTYSLSPTKTPIFFDGEKKIIPSERPESKIRVWGGIYPNAIKEESQENIISEQKEVPGPDSAIEKGIDIQCLKLSDNSIEKKFDSPYNNIGKEKFDVSVELDNVSLSYRRTARFGFGVNKGLRKERVYWALHNISFRLFVGETIGIIGRNGSGKSTLTQLCSGVLFPDNGSVTINGSVQLLSLGLGFRKEMTGRDNIYISGALMGLTRKQIESRVEDIISFAELSDFIDEPMTTYSSGMRSRLGFAVATAIKPDILILDEIMATGDKAFRDKAIKRMQLMQKSAKTVIIVSHSPQQLKKLCSRILWIEGGRLIMDGGFRPVLDAYNNFCQNPTLWLDRNNPSVPTQGKLN